jgi:periplasmic divalent cation tolerance protein
LVTDKVVIFVTAGNRHQARRMAKRLVELRLAACVSLAAPVESIYWWKKKVEASAEVLLIVKTRRALFAQIEAEIRRLHTYATPEIICLPIIEGSADYLKWLDGSLS